ncbi:MAG: glycoside hydrolase family 2 protein [Cellulomonas sp.]|nr:glycoside hydrolase family 2 protein [Cellulomonas sp.]
MHTDLMAAGLLADPYLDDGEQHQHWVGESDWTYSTDLPPVTDDGRVDLVLTGLDTTATVSLDGRELLTTRNMHRSYRVALPPGRRSGRLEIRLDSPRRAARAELDRLGPLPSPFSEERPFIRKMQSNFGWDWGPTLITSAVWRPVLVETWDEARLAAVRPVVEVDPAGTGHVRVHVELERAGQGPLTVRAAVAGILAHVDVPPGATTAELEVRVPHVPLWWPTGMGEQVLHPLVVELSGGDGATLDAWTRRIGFRTVVVETQGAPDGSGYALTVNGSPMFVRGFNWIPDDCFVGCVTRADYRRGVLDAIAMGANLLRVWGGGIAEDDALYEECDSRGLLVWQDFLFACAAYPEEEPFTAEVRAEAQEMVTRLMPHPSLVTWNGSNENLWFWFVQGWGPQLGDRTWGERLYTEVLPQVVAELDPGRHYLISSPSSGDRWHDPNDPDRGVVHVWLPGDYTRYGDVPARFVSEFGFQGPPTRATFDAAVHESAPAPFSPGVIGRQKAPGGTERIEEVMALHLGVPDDFDEWYWRAQLLQARAVAFGIEGWRADAPHCRGVIVWQLNDCWPAISWSAVDVAGRWKPVAYAIRRAFADHLLTWQGEGADRRLVAVNSGSTPWDAVVRVQRFALGGTAPEAEVAGATVRVQVPVGQAVDVTGWADATARTPLDAGLLVATAGAVRAVTAGREDKELPAREPQYWVSCEPGRGQVRVVIGARSLLREATLLVDRIDPDAWADQNLLTLLPGESAVWTVWTARPEAFDEAAVRAVLRTATGNDVGTGAPGGRGPRSRAQSPS